jgi:hypothetical protein
MMFAEAHRIATESFERRLAEERGIGQLAAMTAILSLMLRGLR